MEYNHSSTKKTVLNLKTHFKKYLNMDNAKGRKTASHAPFVIYSPCYRGVQRLASHAPFLWFTRLAIQRCTKTRVTCAVLWFTRLAREVYKDSRHMCPFVIYSPCYMQRCTKTRVSHKQKSISIEQLGELDENAVFADQKITPLPK